MAVQARTQIIGLRDLRRNLRRAGGKDLQKELGKVHKSIGEMVITRLGGAQTGIGKGRGEKIRPSAATGSVQLRVGGAHRSEHPKRRQWGNEQIWPGGMPPTPRPHLIGAANEIQSQIEEAYMDGVEDVLRRAGLHR